MNAGFAALCIVIIAACIAVPCVIIYVCDESRRIADRSVARFNGVRGAK